MYNYSRGQLQIMSDDDLGIAFYDEFGINFDDPKEIIDFISNIDITVNFSIGWAHGYQRDGSIVEFNDSSAFRSIACVALLIGK